jgi:hypothetical protein
MKAMRAAATLPDPGTAKAPTITPLGRTRITRRVAN